MPSEEPQPRSEDPIDGRYAVESELGRGGMGRVYRGRDLRLSRPVAIKFIRELAPDSRAAERFAREARAHSSFSHPNVVSVFDAGVSDGKPYLVTELLRGDTLRARLQRGPLDLPEALRIGLLVARGLAAAHAQGIVHRDLKPENVFVLDDGWVKILDFGIARIAGEAAEETREDSQELPANLTADGAFVGTLGYAAPEQVRGEPVDARADLFSFGSLLYELVRGERAFARDGRAQTAFAVLNESVPALPETLPPRLRKLIESCLEKDRAKRPRSADEVVAELSALFHELQLSDPGGTPLFVRPESKKPWLVAAVAVVALASTGAYFALRTPPRPLTPLERRMQELARKNETQPSALRHFLEGEEQLRAGQEWPAVQSFRAAVADDPNFGLAYYRIATLTQEREPGSARDAIRLALNAPEAALEPRERKLLLAQQAAALGESQKAVALYRAVVEERPDDVEALRDLGQYLFAIGPIHGWPLEDAADAMRRALVLDPFNLEALRALTSIAELQGQPQIVASLTDRFLSLQKDAPLDVRWAHAWSTVDAQGRARAIDAAIASGNFSTQVDLFLRAGFADTSLADPQRLAEQLAQDQKLRAFWLEAQAVIELSRGKPGSARATMAKALALAKGGSLPQFAAWMETLDFVHPGRDQLVAAVGLARQMDETRTTPVRYARRALEGALQARLGDFAAAEALAKELAAMKSPDDTSVGRDMAKAVHARALAAQGRAAEALQTLESQELTVTAYEANFFSGISEQPLRSTILQAAGKPAEAARWEVIPFDTPFALPLVPAVHLRLCELLVQQGQLASAAAHGKAALAAWSDAEPELHAELDRLHACLAASTR